MSKTMTLEEINKTAEKNYNKKFDKSTSFIDDEQISNVFIKDKSEKVSPKIIRYILGEYLEIKDAYRLKFPDDIGFSLDEESFRNTLEEIYKNWDEDNKTKGILYPYSIFGSSKQINGLYQLAKNTAGRRFKLACFILEAIALNGTKIGLSLVYEASRKFKQSSVRHTSSNILNNITKKLSISKEAFADKIIPDFDFDSNGVRIIESNIDDDIKKFKITLNKDFSISIFDEIKNKELKSFPKDFPAEAKKELSKIKSDIKKVLKTQTERLQLVFMNGRKWKINDWKEVFFENPIMKTFAVKLIWGIYDKDDKLKESFRYMEDGTFNNIDDEEIKIKDDSLISLISPIDVNREIIEKWKNQLSDYEIVQPFNQLSASNLEELKESIPNTLTVGSIKNIASKLGMEKLDGDSGYIEGYELFDSYKEASMTIYQEDVYYGTSYTDETNIDIKFNNEDNRFLYGAYLMLLDYIK